MCTVFTEYTDTGHQFKEVLQFLMFKLCIDSRNQNAKIKSDQYFMK